MTGSSCAGRSAATSSGTRITAARSCSLRAARASFRFVRFCVIGSAAAATCLHGCSTVAHARGRHLPRRARRSLRRDRGRVHAHARAASDWDGYAASRLRAPRRGGGRRRRTRSPSLVGRPASSRRRGRARGARLPAGQSQDRAVRSHGTLMEALDGNAIGGLLFEVFGAELTAATGTCDHCGAVAHVASSSSTSRPQGPSFAAGSAEAS